MKKAYSITSIISIIIISFFMLIIIPTTILLYVNFNQALNENTKNYFKQIEISSEVLFEREHILLNSKVSQLSTLLSETNFDFSNELYLNDDIDIFYIKKGDELIDYSASLFDTLKIINTLEEKNVYEKDACIYNIKIDERNYVMLLSWENIINKISGRVEGKVVIGKILNENIQFLSKMKEIVDVDSLSFMVGKDIIVSSLNDMSKIKNITDSLIKNKVYSFANEIYTKINLSCNDEKTILYIIPSVHKKLFINLQNSFNKQLSVIILVFFILGILLFYLSSKFIFEPMNSLLDYARKIKSQKNVKYNLSAILEYNTLAFGIKEIIDELRDIKEQYTLAVDGTQDGLWDWNIDKKNIYLSKKCQDILQVNKEDDLISLEEWKSLILQEDFESFNKTMISHIKQKLPYFQTEFRIKTTSGQIKWLKVKAKALFDENNHAYRMLGFYSDVTVIKDLEEENQQKESYILQRSKINSMTDMLSNISHQWRQPLSVITSLSSSMKMTIDLGISDDKEILRDLNKINQTALGLSNTLEVFKHTYNYVHEKEKFFMDEYIKEKISLLKSTKLYENIDFQLDLEHIEYFGYKDAFGLILGKLVQNSKDAITNQHIQNGLISIRVFFKKNKICLEILDNGLGIKEEIKDNIFEPYFTTKHQSQGVGLSLYMTKIIVHKYFDGEIHCKNKNINYKNIDYKGAEFKILIEKRN